MFHHRPRRLLLIHRMPAVFDPLTIDIEVYQPIRPIDLSCRPGRDQDLLPGPPVLRIDDKVTDAPIGILHEEVLEVTDLAVASMDMVSGDASMLRRCGSPSLAEFRQNSPRAAWIPGQLTPSWRRNIAVAVRENAFTQYGVQP